MTDTTPPIPPVAEDARRALADHFGQHVYGMTPGELARLAESAPEVVPTPTAHSDGSSRG